VNRRGPLIAGAAAGVLAILLIVFLVLPKMGDVSDARAQLVKIEDQEQQLQLQLQQLEAAKADSPQATQEIRNIDEMIPPTADLEGLLLLTSSAANQAGVDFFTVSPAAPTPSADGTFSTISTGISVTGSYFACEEFLHNLETLQRANKVLSLSLSGGAGGASETGTSGTSASTETTSTETVPGELSMQLSAEFYTTDTSSGPGSTPNGSSGGTGDSTAITSPIPTPTPGA
jgi:Tfp pilus assembly protein PilO